MLGVAWAILTHRWAGPIGAVLLALVAAHDCSQTIKLHGAVADRDKAEELASRRLADLTTCRGNQAALQSSLSQQNEAVEAFAKDQAARVAQAERAAQEAAKGRVEAETRAARLLKNPPQGVDACARFNSADKAVLDSLR